MNHLIAVKKASINVRVNEEVKYKAEKTLKKLGLSMSDAVSLLLNQINLKKGIPFDVRIPNTETRKVLDETDKGKNLLECQNVEDLFKQIGI